LIREIKEELSVDIDLLRMPPHIQSNIFTQHFVIVAFECLLAEEAPPPRSSVVSIQQVRWIPRSETYHLDVMPGTLEFLECLDYETVQMLH
ncbi:hypothetical protein LCGC14_1720380, partial [marine sediment metagenome]